MLIFLFNLIFDYNINAGKLQSIIIGFLRQKSLLYFLYAKSMVDLQSYELLFFFLINIILLNHLKDRLQISLLILIEFKRINLLLSPLKFSKFLGPI